MSKTYESDIRYLYENALAQILSIAKLLTPDVPTGEFKETVFILDRVKEIAEAGLNHDFRAIYPGHTEEFHEAIKRRSEQET